MKYFFALILLFSFSLKAEEHVFVTPRHSLETVKYCLATIKEAQQSIELSVCFTGGKILKDFLDACEERLEACKELEVNILASPMLIIERDKRNIAYLKAKYPDRFFMQFSTAAPIMYPEYCSTDNHMKGWVIDEKYFCVGGTNYDEALCTEGTTTPPLVDDGDIIREKLPRGSRDYDIVGRGPIAKQYRIEILKHIALWEHYEKNVDDFIKDPEQFKDKSRYKPIDPTKKVASVSCIDNCPNKVRANAKLIISGAIDKPNKITEEYIRLFKGAQKTISFGNLYCNPVPSLFKEFIDSINRGVKLTFISNGKYDESPLFNQFYYWSNRINYVPYFYGRSYNIFESWMAAKDPVKPTEIYEYYVPHIVYHKKVAVFDKKVSVIGSYNFGVRSDGYDFETLLVVESEEIAKRVLEVMEEDKKYCFKITPEQARTWYFNPGVAYLAALQKQFHGFF